MIEYFSIEFKHKSNELKRNYLYQVERNQFFKVIRLTKIIFQAKLTGNYQLFVKFLYLCTL